ncbi:energy-coupling factor ABC transporter substrate-binding protein [Piscicoccus intestinalis]|uniref:energy-coupling factor ABC transporter substrate-binding protein n=1 Tax=Piscicoccus intestinalis TaxID=746033 RepID=UPI0008388652|nr:energy-coupling factor ABC transporter substrate-binding protein [Piscicoccus intestinalis]
MKRRWWIDVLLVVALVAVVAVSFLLGRQSGDGEFAGTDATVSQVIEDEGHQPWFQPFFEPGSAELESGLFALQAGLGGVVLGYCIGRLHGRRRREAEPPVAREPSPSSRAG